MRIGWSQVADFVRADFVRVDDHPIDGAAVGLTTPGVDIPPFPPALSGDETLFLGLWIAGDDVLSSRCGYFGGRMAVRLFNPRVALTIGGVAGGMSTCCQVPDYEPYPPEQENPIIAIVAGGALLLTEADVSDWARTGDADSDPCRQADPGAGW